MILSKERLIKETRQTGFRQEIIEKVVWLIHLLNHIAQDSYLQPRLALKGGTALNLFYLELPRLSVDADFNYIGAVERHEMLAEKPLVEERLMKLCQRLGLHLHRYPSVHAGGKMVWRYPSAMGNQGNLEIDLNYLYRTPLLPVTQRESIVLANQKVSQLQVLEIHELAAGKLSALFDRGLGRDVFDAAQLFQYPGLDIALLRQCLIPYLAMSSKKRALDLTSECIDIDINEIQDRLIPVLKIQLFGQEKEIAAWLKSLLEQVHKGIQKLLPYSSKEVEFLEQMEAGNIVGELLSTEARFVQAINQHPALQWRIKKGQQ